MDKIHLSWDDIGLLVQELHKDTQHLDTDNTAIIGITRGGLIPAVILSHLKNNCPVFTVGTKSYNGVKRENDVIYQMLNPDEIAQFKQLYIVDDICDTGKTFLNLKNKILHPNIVSCSIVYRQNEIYKPDYSGVQILDEKWVVFPWENHK